MSAGPSLSAEPRNSSDTGAWSAGILTKPDLVDRGTEDKVVDVVRNLVFPLKKGYLVVKCRGQQDIQERLSLAQALQREQAFFEDHPHFRWEWGSGLMGSQPVFVHSQGCRVLLCACVGVHVKVLGGE